MVKPGAGFRMARIGYLIKKVISKLAGLSLLLYTFVG